MTTSILRFAQTTKLYGPTRNASRTQRAPHTKCPRAMRGGRLRRRRAVATEARRRSFVRHRHECAQGRLAPPEPACALQGGDGHAAWRAAGRRASDARKPPRHGGAPPPTHEGLPPGRTRRLDGRPFRCCRMRDGRFCGAAHKQSATCPDRDGAAKAPPPEAGGCSRPWGSRTPRKPCPVRPRGRRSSR